MGRSQESFNKKEVRKKKDKKRKDKEKKKLERKETTEEKSSFDDMIAYVDEYGNITETPPDPEEKEEIQAEDIELSATKDDSPDENAGQHSGTITFFNDEKGFGFISDSQTKQSIFVHISNAEEPLAEGNKVLFEIGKGDKGPIALNVKIER
ncbi:MAG: cold shock domain-containing protein [Bacteroidales bacterium]|nr:cold shock domain-containing protein [Bacteroidales bacterium]